MADEFENGVSAFNQFELSDQFNEGMPVHSMAPAMRRDPEQAAIISRGRPVDVDLMRLRAENPFVPIVEPPILTKGALLSSVDPTASIDIPDATTMIVIGYAAVSNNSNTTVIAAFDRDTITGATQENVNQFPLCGVYINSAVRITNQKKISFRYLPSSGNAYVSVAFYF